MHIIGEGRRRDIWAWLLGTQKYKTLGRYHKISKHASLISQRWLFVHWFFKTNFFICFFFFFHLFFQKFHYTAALRHGISSPPHYLHWLHHLCCCWWRSLCERQKWFKNDVHNENHVKNHVCTMGSSSTVFFCSAA